MNNLLYYISEYFKLFKDEYVIYVDDTPTDSCNVTNESIAFFAKDKEYTIEKDQIAEVSIMTTRLTIKTKCHQEYNFIAKPLSKDEKMQEVISELENELLRILPHIQYSLQVKPYIDNLKRLNNRMSDNTYYNYMKSYVLGSLSGQKKAGIIDKERTEKEHLLNEGIGILLVLSRHAYYEEHKPEEINNEEWEKQTRYYIEETIGRELSERELGAYYGL